MKGKIYEGLIETRVKRSAEYKYDGRDMVLQSSGPSSFYSYTVMSYHAEWFVIAVCKSNDGCKGNMGISTKCTGAKECGAEDTPADDCTLCTLADSKGDRYTTFCIPLDWDLIDQANCYPSSAQIIFDAVMLNIMWSLPLCLCTCCVT
eukprot:TRINITY_DN53980_c0_g1_i1.p1 TRINITY_DN53980_c0_g1~~TRINITY_DN53980_c0_g1_i1.p1  ORF type:complete len:148 (-),score=7.57 TRINITY_DN53980_c0_g1_i1:43-486(-)